MRSSLVSALVSCVDSSHKSKVRRFVQGLSSDELQFIAGFLGACVLDSSVGSKDSRGELATRIARYQRESAGDQTCRSADQEHKMILLLEFLCRSSEYTRDTRTDPRPGGAVFFN